MPKQNNQNQMDGKLASLKEELGKAREEKKDKKASQSVDSLFV
jgi:hypothetical protein